ncbi:MAG: hypothetical protein ACOH2J_13620 [Allorhizobium sp.]
MTKTMITLWRKHRLLLSAFVFATLLTLFFAARFVFFVQYWNDPAHREQPLEGWMTLGYVAHSYKVPRNTLAAALGVVPPEKGKRPTLKQIAGDKGLPVDAFAAEVEAAIKKLRQKGAVE